MLCLCLSIWLRRNSTVDWRHFKLNYVNLIAELYLCLSESLVIDSIDSTLANDKTILRNGLLWKWEAKHFCHLKVNMQFYLERIWQSAATAHGLRWTKFHETDWFFYGGFKISHWFIRNRRKWTFYERQNIVVFHSIQTL